MIADLNKPRSSAMYTIYQEKVYVFGGYTGNKKRSKKVNSIMNNFKKKIKKD
jgi:N-acetylneuraminic acid mutarotase